MASGRKALTDPMEGSAGYDSVEQNIAPKRADDAYDATMQTLSEDINESISVASLRKSKKYMLIGITALIMMLLSWGGYFLVYNMTVRQHQQQCFYQQQEFEQDVKQYVSVNGLMSFPTYLDSTSLSEPTCPDGGEYVWNPIDGTYTCTQHGHA